jgi:hypothetical protein
MHLSADQVELLRDDLDFILPRTCCNTVPLTKGFLLREIERNPDVLLDLVEGMSSSDARSLSVPHDMLRTLISRRSLGLSGNADHDSHDLFSALGE